MTIAAYRLSGAFGQGSGRVVMAFLSVAALGLGLSGCAGVDGTAMRGGNRGGVPSVTDIKGHTPADVRDRLGAPTLTRREPPAEVWQYSAQSCVLDVVFYPPRDNPNNGLRADWVGSRGLDGNPGDPAACLRDVSR
ncbi:hypothetical protein [Insolitispirillum peregrinum]|uniref:hypothetical protein n=1 Tax=Insolitispirillum peregrinum TaxID=80876 RepID=UPI00362072C9